MARSNMGSEAIPEGIAADAQYPAFLPVLLLPLGSANTAVVELLLADDPMDSTLGSITMRVGLHNTTSADTLIIALNGSTIYASGSEQEQEQAAAAVPVAARRQPYPGVDMYVAQMLTLALDGKARALLRGGVNEVVIRLVDRPRGLQHAAVTVTDMELILHHDVYAVGARL